MARATTVRKKASSTNGGNHSPASVTVISARNSLEDEIRVRAYLLYEQEGRQEGRDHEYWVRAESEILERYGLRKD